MNRRAVRLRRETAHRPGPVAGWETGRWFVTSATGRPVWRGGRGTSPFPTVWGFVGMVTVETGTKDDVDDEDAAIAGSEGAGLASGGVTGGV